MTGLLFASTAMSDAANPFGFAIPPEHLALRAGKSDYLNTGRILYKKLNAALASVDKALLETDMAVLDFGCGPARLLQWVSRSNRSWRLHGCDFHEETVQWCKENVPGVEFFISDPLPGFRTDRKYDLIYALSVFTHTPEDMMKSWLSFFQRFSRAPQVLTTTTLSAMA